MDCLGDVESPKVPARIATRSFGRVDGAESRIAGAADTTEPAARRLPASIHVTSV
jgi:hypothetical protein